MQSRAICVILVWKIALFGSKNEQYLRTDKKLATHKKQNHLDSKDSKLLLQAQKRLGKSGIRTCDPSKTDFYVVKSAVFKPIFLITTWDHVDGTKTQISS